MSHADFELAGGGTLGRDHRLGFRNYQDAYIIQRYENCTIAIVTDGCSSGSEPGSSHNEVGARLGALILASVLYGEVCRVETHTWDPGLSWSNVTWQTELKLSRVIGMLGPDIKKNIQDYFLFSLNGALLTADTAYFFSLGDGIIFVNGKVYEAGPRNNTPPYLAYRLVNAEGFVAEDLEIQVLETLPLAALDNFLIGCDGLLDLMKANGKKLPGLDSTFPGIERFWEEDRFFSGNPDIVSRQLRLISRDWPKQHPEAGLLPDDTTLVAGRRSRSS